MYILWHFRFCIFIQSTETVLVWSDVHHKIEFISIDKTEVFQYKSQNSSTRWRNNWWYAIENERKKTSSTRASVNRIIRKENRQARLAFLLKKKRCSMDWCFVELFSFLNHSFLDTFGICRVHWKSKWNKKRKTRRLFLHQNKKLRNENISVKLASKHRLVRKDEETMCGGGEWSKRTFNTF